jgi:flagellar biogenesis protein FliO
VVGPVTSTSATSYGAGIPYLTEKTSTGDLGLRTSAALLVCVLVGAGAVYWLRNGRKGVLALPTGRRIDVIESRTLGPKNRLVVVRYDELQLLLSQTDTGLTLLHQKPTAIHPAEPPAA